MLIFAENRATNSEQSAEIEMIRAELVASRAEQKAEAEENKWTAVNAINFENLIKAIIPPSASPPVN